MAQKAHLLIVDDEANTLASLSRAFRLEGHEATVCDNANKALELAKSQSFDLILSDVVMPGKDGLTLLEELKAQGVSTPVVMMSGQAHIEMAVRATRLGALDFLEKPISTEKLLLTVENALKLGRLERENRDLERRLGKHEIVWKGDTMRRVMVQVERVAASETRVCILGETGTGKELVARAIHRRSRRASRAFVAVNCAAIPRDLIPSELFGHEKGAFTGALQRRLGRFELAEGGTIFLDEVGELSSETQVALLRVLQEREFERVGGRERIQVDVRVIAATNRDLTVAVADGTFRQDLFYRLNVFPIEVPPLRDRREDIAVLVEHFVGRYARKAGKAFRCVSKRTLDHLQSYPWPGNIRELQNVIERSVIVSDTDQFVVDESWLSAAPQVESRLGLSSTLAIHEKAIIEDALRACEGRVFGPSGAAARLGIPRSTLESKIRALKIKKSRFRTRTTKNS